MRRDPLRLSHNHIDSDCRAEFRSLKVGTAILAAFRSPCPLSHRSAHGPCLQNHSLPWPSAGLNKVAQNMNAAFTSGSTVDSVSSCSNSLMKY